jgi:hypothetical protein
MFLLALAALAFIAASETGDAKPVACGNRVRI